MVVCLLMNIIFEKIPNFVNISGNCILLCAVFQSQIADFTLELVEVVM